MFTVGWPLLDGLGAHESFLAVDVGATRRLDEPKSPGQPRDHGGARECREERDGRSGLNSYQPDPAEHDLARDADQGGLADGHAAIDQLVVDVAAISAEQWPPRAESAQDRDRGIDDRYRDE